MRLRKGFTSTLNSAVMGSAHSTRKCGRVSLSLSLPLTHALSRSLSPLLLLLLHFSHSLVSSHSFSLSPLSLSLSSLSLSLSLSLTHLCRGVQAFAVAASHSAEDCGPAGRARPPPTSPPPAPKSRSSRPCCRRSPPSTGERGRYRQNSAQTIIIEPIGDAQGKGLLGILRPAADV